MTDGDQTIFGKCFYQTSCDCLRLISLRLFTLSFGRSTQFSQTLRRLLPTLLLCINKHLLGFWEIQCITTQPVNKQGSVQQSEEERDREKEIASERDRERTGRKLFVSCERCTCADWHEKLGCRSFLSNVRHHLLCLRHFQTTAVLTSSTSTTHISVY